MLYATFIGESLMFENNKYGNLDQRSFGAIQKEKLGNYIYALIDPRDRKMFYVGKGVGDRMFEHFKEAEDCHKNNKIASSKIIRILDIWNNDEDVEWAIICHSVDKSRIFEIESAVYNAVSVSQNGSLLNSSVTPHSSLLNKDDVKALAAKPINPEVAYKTVFVFPIQNALEKGGGEYEATRRAWYVKQEYQKIPSFAVGVSQGISKGSFRIKSWHVYHEKHEFIGDVHEPLNNYSWLKIINTAKGYWQRGNYLIVEFDGVGKFRIIRGSGPNNKWIDCVD